MARTIIAKGDPIQKEGTVLAANSLNPGHLIDIDPATGNVMPHNRAGLNAVPRFCVERSDVGDDADTAITSGERANYVTARSGDEIYARLAASATAVTRGDFLESGGDGTLRLLTSSAATAESVRASVVAHALESVDNSGGGTEAFILVEVF
jgi:hypothetical protein